jgi:outer membrane assembly lipoprotein YfiO
MKKVAFVLFTLASLNCHAQSPLKAQIKRDEHYEMLRPKAQEYHEQLMQAYHESNWKKLIKAADALKSSYPQSPLAADASFYMGVAYFKEGELELANEAFTDYLKGSNNLSNFEQAVRYKYEIGNLYESGAKKRLFGIKKLPKVVPAKDEALAVYDEVIAALPRSEMAAEALFKKANLLVAFEDYKDSIEMYQTLIRRFPKNPLAARSFISIGDVYLKQCKAEFPDPALVELAEVNLKRFQVEYPTDPLVIQLKEQLKEMKEIFAEELLTVGNYYVKKKQYDSAFIYYKSILKKYSDTRYRDLAYKQIDTMKKKARNGKSYSVEEIQ